MIIIIYILNCRMLDKEDNRMSRLDIGHSLIRNTDCDCTRHIISQAATVTHWAPSSLQSQQYGWLAVQHTGPLTPVTAIWLAGCSTHWAPHSSHSNMAGCSTHWAPHSSHSNMAGWLFNTLGPSLQSHQYGWLAVQHTGPVTPVTAIWLAGCSTHWAPHSSHINMAGWLFNTLGPSLQSQQ